MRSFEKTIAYENRHQIAAAYERGLSQKTLADQWGVCRRSVRKAVIAVLGHERFAEIRDRNKVTGPMPMVSRLQKSGRGVLDVNDPDFESAACRWMRKGA